RRGKRGTKPGGGPSKPPPRLIHIDAARTALPERRATEGQPVTGPALFLQRQQPGEFGLGAAEPILDAPKGLVLAEPMGNYNDERFRHRRGISLMLTGM